MSVLVFIRHGVTELNNKGVYFGQLNPSLSDDGVKQLEKTKKILANIEYEIIYSSSLKRASETAQIVNIRRKEIVLDERLKELNFGIFEGYSYDELLKNFPLELAKSERDWKKYNYVTGESVEELQSRAVEFVEEIKTEKGVKVIVTHWGIINSILSYYFSNELDSYWKFDVKNGGVVIIEFVDNFPILKGLNIGE